MKIQIINIFNGKDDFIKPDEIAGNKGAISLGTNICGRGTNINSKGNCLHVIVSYYSSNIRLMKQAFGRTARQEVNKIIGSRTFLKLYLRRTLAGCEFGVCLNLDLESNKEEFEKDNLYCFVDKDPLLLFTIYVRSLTPVLAIILISLLVYLTVVGKRIAKWFTFPSNVKEAFEKPLLSLLMQLQKEFHH